MSIQYRMRRAKSTINKAEFPRGGWFVGAGAGAAAGDEEDDDAVSALFFFTLKTKMESFKVSAGPSPNRAFA